ncbi:unnamed protein product [Pocillopora meandrina]|uniref:Uncharacterized protein n=1 Tax=Pocillopora meandrina TaxID=46732 RepID=A0AAU9W010_9CNID|nr:unnamed protein product [Pocillopora meandrina]
MFFQTGNVTREGMCEPVAIETQFLSVNRERERAVSVNLVRRDSIISGKLEEDVQVHWELETFNGNRYSVELP